jgi:3D (Asp-Asp-Asp) domain-containing protein
MSSDPPEVRLARPIRPDSVLIFAIAVSILAAFSSCSFGQAPLPIKTSAGSKGWALTVYYTAVESYHSGLEQQLQGCPELRCANGQSDLGSYADDFVTAVRDEGTGRITAGSNAGKYLNWSVDVGFWLDAAPRDARGGTLAQWTSAAADPSVAFGTQFVVLDCGVDDATLKVSDIPLGTCAKIKAANWRVVDRFSSPHVGRHLDLYIGEENEPNFVKNNPLVISTANATTSLR